MARDRTARARVRQLLASDGPIVDPSGYASGALKDAISYEGSSVAFIQLIASMERDNEIVREIRGKRTYKISASPSVLASQRKPRRRTSSDEAADRATVQVSGLPPIQLDYDQLARAIVRELASVLSTRPDTADSVAPVRANSSLQAERADYARRLDAARSELDALLAEAERLSVDRVS